MRKYQKGFTIIELLFVLWVLFIGAIGAFLVGSVVYAIGKYLFGWWG